MKSIIRAAASVILTFLAFSCKPEDNPVVHVSDITLSQTSISMTVGETNVLTALISPGNAKDKTVTWSSSNPSVATADDGKVTAVAPGSATVTARTEDGGKTATCSVTVSAQFIPVEAISLNSESITLCIGDQFQLEASISPEDATDRSVTWVSSDDTLASVDECGLVSALSVGDVTVTAAAGDMAKSCLIHINPKPLTFTSAGKSSVALMKDGTPLPVEMEIRLGCGDWDAYSIGHVIVLNDGETVSFRSRNSNGDFSMDWFDYYYFEMTGELAASGTVMSLLDGYKDGKTLTPYCFSGLFMNCSSLTSSPELPATSLSKECYERMFYGCTNLAEAPDLPATELTYFCYYLMFSGCTSLKTAPDLPAASVAEGCYTYMFNGCSSLESAPRIHAESLAISPSGSTMNYGCFEGMFTGCSRLTSAPELPAVMLSERCYSYMFSGCTGLTSMPVLPAKVLKKDCYHGMFSGCTGLKEAQEIPAEILDYQCCSEMFSGCESLTSAPSLPSINLAVCCYTRMFSGCTSLRTPPELPATRLMPSCYSYMFAGCTSLSATPELPAVEIASTCYSSMFQGCTSLSSAPDLPAVKLEADCYEGMFEDCVNLKKAPELPAVNLSIYCYRNMFKNCTSLTTAPELPAYNMEVGCYQSMFMGCTSLTAAPVLVTPMLNNNECYKEMFKNCRNLSYVKALFLYSPVWVDGTVDWLDGVAETGTFVKRADAVWDEDEFRGPSGIPYGWNIEYGY